MKSFDKISILTLLFLFSGVACMAQTNFYEGFTWNSFQGNDFITPAEDQKELGPCHIFAAVGLVEAMYELLYFSSNSNLELSERHIYSPCINCYSPDVVIQENIYQFLNDPSKGVVAEDGSNYDYHYPSGPPYIFLAANCTDPPGSYKYQASSELISLANYTTQQIQNLIYQVGPLAIGTKSPYIHGDNGHSMLLHGWIKEGTVLKWLFKDSWPGAPTESYKVSVSDLNLPSLSAKVWKITSVRKFQKVGTTWNQITVTRSCSGDQDCDGYCFWGVGPKPCNHGTSQLQDYNDNNSALGPLQSTGWPLALNPKPCSYITAPINEMVIYGPAQTGVCNATHTLNCSQLTNVTGDNIDWVPYFGSTPTANTGPDVSAPGASGMYLYLEATGGCYGQNAILDGKNWIEIPNNSNNYALNYYYHMYGSTMGSLKVKILTYPNTTWVERGIVKSGNKGNTWFNEIINLNEFKGKYIKIRFEGITGYGESSDLAIQKIIITSSAGLKNTQESTLSPDKESEFSVFPNPSKGQLNIVTRNNLDFSVVLYNLLGNEVYNGKFNSSQVLDVSNLAKGIYILKIRYFDQKNIDFIQNIVIQ